jgi:alpha-ketoglutarate-dependent taurine dioxygenase
MTTHTVARIVALPQALRLEWQDGRVHEYASIWLRDNLHAHRDAQSGQRLVDIADLPMSPAIRSAILEPGAVRVEWQDQEAAAVFALDWLAERAEPQGSRPERQVRVWPPASHLHGKKDFAWIPFRELTALSGGKLSWMTRLLQTGMAFIDEVPATEAGLELAVEPLGSIQETNYGRVFDVRSMPNPDNLAYSDLGLGLHTDNPYREPVPGFQALHALVTSPDGGESLFADGFALARDLQIFSPEDFKILTTTPVPFYFRSANADLYAERPLIQLRGDGEVSAVHYNSRSIAPLHATDHSVEGFYAAYRHFAQLLRDPKYQMRYRLNDGELVVFDNQRVLHGRTAFTSAKHPRHLRGCYLTRDSLFSEAGMLRRRLPPGEGA